MFWCPFSHHDLVRTRWSCADSPFLYPPAGHVVTGDLTCIPEKGLWSLFKEGPKYRLPSRIDFTKSRDVVEDALQTYCKRKASECMPLKLYYRYEYTKPCMINRIWVLKQLWLQVIGHAWFHFQRFHWPVRNGEGAKNIKWKYMSPTGFEPTPRQSKTRKSAP